MRVLVDTHFLVWWAAGRKIPQQAASLIQDPANDLYASAASVWEIAIKRALGKLEAPDGLTEAIDEAGFDVLPIVGRDAERAASLPRHHRDPFDRMLVAQGQRLGALIVSRDPAFAAYAADVLLA